MARLSVLKGAIVVALISMVMVFSAESFGQPRPPMRPGPRVVVRQPLPPFGRVIPRLPPGDFRVVVGGAAFFFHSGIFYRQGPGGYVVVGAPIGAVVPAIPDGFVTFVSGGITYYHYGGIYYRAVPSGYEVVEAPPDSVVVYESPEEAAPAQPMEERVSVTSHRLNVRSGPGKEHPVIEQVDQGSVLIIKGTAPEWYYVQLPNGKYGWVDKAYTSPSSSPASG